MSASSLSATPMTASTALAAGVACHGVRVLEPGRSLEGKIRIGIELLQRRD